MYSHSHNAADELFYAKESLEHFINAGDDYNVWFMDGYIATAYANTLDWEKSDSLFSRFRSQDIKDTLQYARFLMNAAKTKILLPEPRPEECISLVEESLISDGVPRSRTSVSMLMHLNCQAKSLRRIS